MFSIRLFPLFIYVHSRTVYDRVTQWVCTRCRYYFAKLPGKPDAARCDNCVECNFCNAIIIFQSFVSVWGAVWAWNAFGCYHAHGNAHYIVAVCTLICCFMHVGEIPVFYRKPNMKHELRAKLRFNNGLVLSLLIILVSGHELNIPTIESHCICDFYGAFFFVWSAAESRW